MVIKLLLVMQCIWQTRRSSDIDDSSYLVIKFIAFKVTDARGVVAYRPKDAFRCQAVRDSHSFDSQLPTSLWLSMILTPTFQSVHRFGSGSQFVINTSAWTPNFRGLWRLCFRHHHSNVTLRLGALNESFPEVFTAVKTLRITHHDNCHGLEYKR